MKDSITKAELLEKLKGLPDDATITFHATSWEELNGKLREYAITIESVSVNIYADCVHIRLRDEKPED
jgi:hypothetical protein